MSKKCFFCGSKNVVHNGLRGYVQDCGRQFDGGLRTLRKQLVEQIVHDYVEGKQTYQELSDKYGKHPSSVYSIVHASLAHPIVVPKHKEVVVLIDTTYWGRNFGMVTAKDALRDVILWHKYINRHEREADYVEGTSTLRNGTSTSKALS